MASGFWSVQLTKRQQARACHAAMQTAAAKSHLVMMHAAKSHYVMTHAAPISRKLT
jgi:hypothetical protein